MTTNFLVLSLYIFCFPQFASLIMGCPQSQRVEPSQDVFIHGITKEEAIRIAKKHAQSIHKPLERFDVFACELTIFWRIIFDGGGPEYVVDKKSGLIRRIQTIAEDWPKQTNADSIGKTPISREQAIEVAKRDTVDSIPGTDIDHFTITACELQRVWRVFVEFKLNLERGRKDLILPHSSAPNYVIDKKTGKILFRQRYGSSKP